MATGETLIINKFDALNVRQVVFVGSTNNDGIIRYGFLMRADWFDYKLELHN